MIRPVYAPGTPRMLYEAYVTLHLRCLCPVCLRLDARYPGEGYQLALFPYRREKRVHA